MTTTNDDRLLFLAFIYIYFYLFPVPSLTPSSCPEISFATTVPSDCSGRRWNGATATGFGRVPMSTSKTVNYPIVIRYRCSLP